MAETRFDVSTVGEVLLRLSVPLGCRLETRASMDVFPAGAEANVTVALTQLGRRCAWISALPANALGRLVIQHLRRVGINLDGIVWRETGRLGVYYVEFAALPRTIQAIYDRTNSCAAQLRADEINWEYLLDTRLLHLTGITPPLSPTCKRLVEEAIARARAAGVPISFDINYRQKLWTEGEAARTLAPLIREVEILFCAQTDAQRLFSDEGEPEAIAQAMAARTGARQVIISCRERGVVAWDGRQLMCEPARPAQMVDRLGAGDALAAGVIHGWLDGDLRKGLRYGAALAALALSHYGDAVITTPEEVASIVESATNTPWR